MRRQCAAGDSGPRHDWRLTREQVLLNALRHSKIALELKPGDLLLLKLFQRSSHFIETASQFANLIIAAQRGPPREVASGDLLRSAAQVIDCHGNVAAKPYAYPKSRRINEKATKEIAARSQTQLANWLPMVARSLNVRP